MAIATASSRSLAASISETSAKAARSFSGSASWRHVFQRSVALAGTSACEIASARKARSACVSPMTVTSSRVAPIFFNRRDKPNCGWLRLEGSGLPSKVSSPTMSHWSCGIVMSRPGRTTVPSASLEIAAISSAAAGTDPVEPATITGPLCSRSVIRRASPRRIEARCFAGEERFSSSSRVGQKPLAIFRNSAVSCHHSACSPVWRLSRSFQSRSSVSIASISSASARASQIASAGLAGATSGDSECTSSTIFGNWLRQARISRPSSSSRAVPPIGRARSISSGATRSKNP